MVFSIFAVHCSVNTKECRTKYRAQLTWSCRKFGTTVLKSRRRLYFSKRISLEQRFSFQIRLILLSTCLIDSYDSFCVCFYLQVIYSWHPSSWLFKRALSHRSLLDKTDIIWELSSQQLTKPFVHRNFNCMMTKCIVADHILVSSIVIGCNSSPT